MSENLFTSLPLTITKRRYWRLLTYIYPYIPVICLKAAVKEHLLTNQNQESNSTVRYIYSSLLYTCFFFFYFCECLNKIKGINRAGNEAC